MSTPSIALAEMNDAELSTLLHAAISELSTRGTPASFKALIDASSQLGTSLGESARQLAASGSWAQVGDLSGTTRQAAWARWR